jgi:hypothetical protein
VNLFKSYELIEDDKFSTYVQYVQFGYSTDPSTYKVCTLMNSIEINYKLRIEAGTRTLVTKKVSLLLQHCKLKSRQ